MSLAQIAEAVAERKLPPVEQWSPDNVDDSHMRIAADGTWYHEGSPIKRPGMVLLGPLKAMLWGLPPPARPHPKTGSLSFA